MSDMAFQLRLWMFASLLALPRMSSAVGFDLAVMLLALLLMALTLAATWCDARARR